MNEAMSLDGCLRLDAFGRESIREKKRSDSLSLTHVFFWQRVGVFLFQFDSFQFIERQDTCCMAWRDIGGVPRLVIL